MLFIARFSRTSNRLAAGLLALLLATFSVAATAAGEGERRAFTEAEIAKNVQDYLNVVFGGAPPRLNDYLRLEGSQNRSEYHLELAECEKTWGVSIYLKCDMAQLDKRCEQWISRRNNTPAKAESLYFQTLRRAVPTPPSSVVIKEVRKAGEAGGPYTVIAQSASGLALELSHASVPAEKKSGLVSLIAVDGKSVDEILGMP